MSLPSPKTLPKPTIKSSGKAAPRPPPKSVNLSQIQRNLGKRLERSRVFSAFGGPSPVRPISKATPKSIAKPSAPVKPSPKAPEKAVPKPTSPAQKPAQAAKPSPKTAEKPAPKKKKDTGLDKDFDELEKLSKF